MNEKQICNTSTELEAPDLCPSLEKFVNYACLYDVIYPNKPKFVNYEKCITIQARKLTT